jgi:cyanate lyase
MEESSKASIVDRLLALKRKSGKSYSQIAEETGLTNVYVGQLLRRQAQLSSQMLIGAFLNLDLCPNTHINNQKKIIKK